MHSTPNPREDGRVAATINVLPPEPGVRRTPTPREDGHVTTTVDGLPPEPGVRRTPSPLEDGRVTTSRRRFTTGTGCAKHY